MKAELSCSFSISVPITILSRRHHKIKKLCSDILNMVCSKVISRAFRTGKDRRRVWKRAAEGEKKEKVAICTQEYILTCCGCRRLSRSEFPGHRTVKGSIPHRPLHHVEICCQTLSNLSTLLENCIPYNQAQDCSRRGVSASFPPVLSAPSSTS